MKKNVMMRIASLLLIAVLITTCGISGTYAKYVSTATGSDTARVAKWEVNLNDEQMQMTHTIKFNIFDTIYEDNLQDEEADEHLKSAKTDDMPIIAPGTAGQFEITVVNASEVAANIEIAFTNDNTDIPLQFSDDGGQTWKTDIEDLNFEEDYDALQTAGYNHVIWWKWAYNVDATADAVDTGLGLVGEAEVTIGVTITATQIN